MGKKKAVILWHCTTEGCPEADGAKEPMGFDAMGAHLQEAHGVDTKTQQFARSLMSHMDGRDFFMSVYRYEGHGVTFIKTIRQERADDDLFKIVMSDGE